MEYFSKNICKKLGYYVYRLVDPRNGQTFYVGKGKNNRVFAHIKESLINFNGESYLEEDEDETSVKIQQIREIKQAGLNVIIFVHRWGLQENEAFEVEAALIDCYSGLTNKQAGHDSERGVANIEMIKRILELKIFDENNVSDKEYMIIKIRQDFVTERGSIYETVRGHWKIDSIKARTYKYVLASLYGEVVGIYKNVCWKQSPTREGRYIFEGEEITINSDPEVYNKYMHKRLPERYMRKGVSNPILYQSDKK